jgi:hypothetical protein
LRGHVHYLALKTGAEIVKTLREEERFHLTPSDEATVGHRILEEFSNFLSLKVPSGAETALEVDRFRSARTGEADLRVEAVIEVLDEYGPDVTLDQFQEGPRMTRKALLQRFGGGG